MNEAGNAVANTATGRSSGGDAFIQSARQKTFCQLLGLPISSAYASVGGIEKPRNPFKSAEPQEVSAEGKFDLSKFNA